MPGIFDRLGFPFLGHYGQNEGNNNSGDGGKPTPLDDIVRYDALHPWPGDMVRNPKNGVKPPGSGSQE